MTPKQMVKMLDAQLMDALAENDKMRAELADVRNAALEDAAAKVESLWAYRTCSEVAVAIRAMQREPNL